MQSRELEYETPGTHGRKEACTRRRIRAVACDDLEAKTLKRCLSATHRLERDEKVVGHERDTLSLLKALDTDRKKGATQVGTTEELNPFCASVESLVGLVTYTNSQYGDK